MHLPVPPKILRCQSKALPSGAASPQSVNPSAIHVYFCGYETEKKEPPPSNLCVNIQHAFNLFGVHSEKLDGFPARSSDAFLENEGRREAAVNQRMTPCKTGGPKRMMMDRCNRTLKRLRCKVRGFPFPIIYWKRNNVLLQPTQDYRITQKKRRSTLAIRRHPEADSEWYECVARDVDGNEISHVFPPIKKPKERNHTGTSTTSTESPNLGRGKIDTAAHPRIPCKPEMDRVYCRNGGTCFYEEVIKEYSCECANGYRGRRCEEKSSDQSSMYRQNPLYTCNVGLYTKYDDC
ncbi:hypothetical protein MTP99_010121 [Tenebrio molitor]|nr:hypothetical protein MTP99_010121 [Tenebrio molitor]